MHFILLCQFPDSDLTVSLHVEILIVAWEEEQRQKPRSWKETG